MFVQRHSNALVINFSGFGRGTMAMAFVDEIARAHQEATSAGLRYYVVCDATNLHDVTWDFAYALRDVARCFLDNTIEYVAIVPNGMQRVMARTVAKLARFKLALFRDVASAETYLQKLGVDVKIVDALPT